MTTAKRIQTPYDGVYHHSAVSLDYLEEHKVLLYNDRHILTDAERRAQIQRWRKEGYVYAPPCGSVKRDGRCAGHEKE